MVSYANGRVPLTALTLIAPNERLINATARAFKNAQMIYRMTDGTRVGPVSSFQRAVGSAYRDYATQLLFVKASRGDRAAIKATDLDLSSTVSIAAAGYSSHGKGTRVDLLFNGHEPTAANLDLMGRYGFTREFGSADACHFMHDGKTAISGVRGFDKISLTAAWLTKIGYHTAAVHTGRRDPDFILAIQTQGTKDGIYRWKRDGITGPHTEATFDHYWNVLKRA